LAGIIKDAEKFLLSVNGEPKDPEDLIKRIKIRKNGMEITFFSPDEMKNYEKKPEVAYGFSYGYFYPKGKISQVNLDFWDVGRRISIEGTESNQIDALFSMLKETIESKESLFGGPDFRNVLFLVLLMFFTWLVTVGFHRSIKIGLKRLILAFCILSGLGILYLKFNLFPGTAIYSGDASFIVRYSAYIGFLGLVFTTGLSLLLYYLSKKKAKPL
jgi:uncharacterized membrane protein